MDEVAPAERWRTYGLCLAGWLFDFYDLVLFAYVAGAVGRDLGWGARFAQDKALVVGIALLTSAAGGIVFGGLSDRYGRRAVMTWTILLYSLSTGLTGLASGLAALALLRALTGLGVGGEWAAGHALMAEIFPKERRGLASALLQAGEPIGVALAVVAGLWLEPKLGWRWVFAVSAVPAFLVLLVRRHMRESPVWEAGRERREREGVLGPYKDLLRLHWRRALQALVLGSSKLGTYWVTYVWLPEYFSQLGVFSSIKLEFILVAQVSQLAGMLAFGFLSDRFGRRPAFTGYSLLTAAGLVALAGYGAEMTAHPALFWPAMLAVGLGSGCTAGFGALLAELFPTSVRNTAMGAVYNLSRGVQFPIQLLMGLLVARVGAAHGLFLAVGFALITASWVWTFPETRGILLAEE